MAVLSRGLRAKRDRRVCALAARRQPGDDASGDQHRLLVRRGLGRVAFHYTVAGRYRTHAALAENSSLADTLEQIQSLEKVADLIRQANSQWQGGQDAAGRTVAASQEIAERMKTESGEFMKFIENAHDQERAGLRLEVEKLRKMEGDWLKVVVQMLDHTFALFRAAERSGQQNLIMQLGQFQNALRDAARRMGLTPFLPSIGEKIRRPRPPVGQSASNGR